MFWIPAQIRWVRSRASATPINISTEAQTGVLKTFCGSFGSFSSYRPPRLPPFRLIKVWSSETSVRSSGLSLWIVARTQRLLGSRTLSHRRPSSVPLVFPSKGGMEKERDMMNDTIQRPESFLYIFLPSLQVQVLSSLIKINRKN